MEGVSGYAYEVDASSLFMLESTGDSEVDAGPTAQRGSVAMEDDDAESCSCDDLGSERSDSYDFEGIEGECCEDEGEERGGGGNTAAEEDVRRDEGGGGGWFGRFKPCLSAESKSGGDFMNEMERNKLFWEACLAS